jgi:RNA polymerase sigma-70 factor (ECF subfamily)
MASSALHNEPLPASDRTGAATAAEPGRQVRSRPTTGPGAGDDADAFLRSLYAEHSASMRSHAARMLSDPHQAEDVVQETMLRAWCKSDTLSPERGSVGGWLSKVAHNIAVDRLRAKRARPPEVDESYTDAATWSVTDHAEQAVDSVFVARALAKLTPSHRAVLYEVYFADRTCTEAAVVLGIPVGTVKSRLYHALRRLRVAIEQEQL